MLYSDKKVAGGQKDFLAPLSVITSHQPIAESATHEGPPAGRSKQNEGIICRMFL